MEGDITSQYKMTQYIQYLLTLECGKPTCIHWFQTTSQPLWEIKIAREIEDRHSRKSCVMVNRVEDTGVIFPLKISPQEGNILAEILSAILSNKLDEKVTYIGFRMFCTNITVTHKLYCYCPIDVMLGFYWPIDLCYWSIH